KFCFSIWERIQRFQIGIQFIIQTAFQLSALSRKLLWIQRKLLIARRRSVYRTEIRQPSRTTKFATTTANAAQTCSFLAETYLFHFNARVECSGKFFYKFAKIYTIFGGV